MRVLHVTMGIAPSSGGPTRSVKGICRALSNVGVEVTLLVLHGHDVFENQCGTNVVYGSITDLDKYDLVHIQGLWDLRLARIANKCIQKKIKYVVSPRGMLDPWALSVKKWKKLIAMAVYQRHVLRNASCFHVTAPAEALHVQQLGFSQPCIVAPNGVDCPLLMPKGSSEGVKTAIFLSRLHPGKGLLLLADAWSKVRPKGWRMRVVGPDMYGHKSIVVNRLLELGISDSWEFVDMVDDERKWAEYSASDILIHPSVSENFGITIAEGLAAGIPVIATQGAPWRDLIEYGCGWWIENQSVDALSEALQIATSISDDQRRAMGARGKELIISKYSWKAIAEDMIKGYEECLRS